jgi:hypothetical protein
MGMPAALVGRGLAQSVDDVPPPPLAVGATIDLSVASTGQICSVAIAPETYLTVEDQGLWVLHGDGKTIEKVSAPADAVGALASDGAAYYLGTTDGLYVGLPGNWQRKEDGPISALCVRSDPPLYLAGGRGAVWRSDDGQHWNAMPFPERTMLACAMGDGIAYAATTNGVLVSIDGGYTWVERSTGLRTLFVGAVALDGDRVFVGTSGNGLYVSTDHARTWNVVAGSPDIVNDVAVSGEDISLLSEGRMFRSTDGGDGWTASDAPGGFRLAAVGVVANARAGQ